MNDKQIYYEYDKITKIDTGIERGYRWLIMFCRWHPCAYVGITADHPIIKSKYGFNPCDGMFSSIVHGGVTYFGSCSIRDEMAGIRDRHENEIRWIGWDYGHYGDYDVPNPKFEDDDESKLERERKKKWTYDEIRKECSALIDELVAIKRWGIILFRLRIKLVNKI